MTPLPPPAWRLLVVLAGAKLALHALSSGRLAYGLMTDELYYLDCANQLAWGYVDHPPLSVALLRLATELFGTSILAIRSVAAIASTATLVLTALLARELGGGRVAQGIAAAAVFASPVHLSMGGFHSMNPIDMALWSAGFLLLARLANGGDPRLWLVLGATLGLGAMNRHSMLWFTGGLGVVLLATQERRWLSTRWPWLAAGVATTIVAPHVIWQIQHDWPTWTFLRNTAVEKRIVASHPMMFLATQLGVTGVPLWPVGLAALAFSPRLVRFRHIGWIVVCVLVLLASSGSAKLYYAAPAYSVAIAAAAVVVEAAGMKRRTRWVPRLVAGGLFIAGIAAAPYAISLLAPARLVALQEALGVGSASVDVTDPSPLHQGFAQMFHGEAVTRAVFAAYLQLPARDRESVGILTHEFGESGGINFYGPALGLPRAIGTQTGYGLWGPQGVSGEVMIEVSDSEDELRNRYAEVTRVAEIDCPYCMPRLTRKAVYLCRRPHRALAEIWPSLVRFR